MAKARIIAEEAPFVRDVTPPMICPHCQRPNLESASRCVHCLGRLFTERLHPRDPYIGQAIAGRFRVLDLLGEGGMGRVYLAEQPMGRTLRKVAVKTLQARYAKDPQLVARFERECSLVSQLEHPNTIQFFDFGQTESGDLYIVMEYVEGCHLAEVLSKEGPMPPERVARILRQITGALDEAHHRGIVHRDLKPSNVMLTTRAGQADFVKVLDFGIAKRKEGPEASRRDLTQKGTILGTPPYMSPEQFTGQEPDLRSDLYSLAIMAYELLTGKLPFLADTPWEWATRHMSAMPFPFEAHPIGEHVPFPMKQAIMRALAKDPDHRPRSAGAFFEEMVATMPTSPMHWPGPEFPKTEAMKLPPTEAFSQGPRTELGSPPFFDDERRQASSFIAPPPRAKAPIKNERKPSIGLVLGALLGLPLLVGGLVLALGSSDEALPSSPGPQGEPSQPAPNPAVIPAARGGCPNGMAHIPEGSFWMGSNDGDADEKPVHRVTVAAFCFDTTEVTVSAYAECVRNGRCPPVGSVVDWAGITESDRGFWSQFCNRDESERGSHPVSCVDWEQANAYCRSMGKRLPTEEEWEYAARGGEEGRTYPWGEAPPSRHLLNACGGECSALFSRLGRPQKAMYLAHDGYESSAPVASYPQGRSAHGLYDLAGNVWEWTSSRACDYPNTSCFDSRRVCRGGTWFNNAASNVRAANRYMVAPSARSFDIGFRCAADG